MTIRPITTQDADVLWQIIEPIIRAGDTWVYAPNSTREQMLDIWYDTHKHTYLCEIDDQVVGTFFIKANQPDLGSHVANAGYMVCAKHRGKGIAEAMCRFSINEAKRLGFKAMQFNIVIKTNEVAVRLWQRCGFEIVGTIPKAYQHQTLGLTDALVMYQWVAD